MALSDAKPAGKIPAMQKPKKRLRQAHARRQGPLVGQTRKPRA
jgi:hypothetical protein